MTKSKADALSKGRRLTAQEKAEITNASMDVTNTELAERYETTLNTIGRYRKGSRRGRRPAATRAAAAGRASSPRTKSTTATPGLGFKAVFEGGEMVIRLSRSQLLRLLADMPG